jgi:hypothetical protein
VDIKPLDPFKHSWLRPGDANKGSGQ